MQDSYFLILDRIPHGSPSHTATKLIYFILLVNIGGLKMATLLLEGKEVGRWVGRYGDFLELDMIPSNIRSVSLGKIYTLPTPPFPHP